MDVGLGRCPGTTSKSGGSCIEQQPDLRLRCGLEGLPALNELGVIALKRAEDRAECRLAATIAAVNQRVPTIFTAAAARRLESRSDEHPSDLQSLMRISYAVFCFHTKTKHTISRTN